MTTRSANTEAVTLLATVSRLASRNRWQQRDRRFVVMGVAVFAVAIVAIAWLANTYVTSITESITLALRFPIVIVVIVGWIAMSVAARNRRQSRQDAERSWLAALPLGQPAFAASARRQLATTLGVALSLLLALLLALSWMLQLPSRSVLTLSLLVSAGATLGAVFGWALARKDPRPPKIRLPRSARKTEAQHFPLGRWPLRHSRAHADLAMHARAIGALLLSLPIGVPPQAVVAIIVFGLAALAIWDTSRALLATTRLAGPWLRSLPSDSFKAALALGGRSISVITIAAAIMLVATVLPMGTSVAEASAMILATGLAFAGTFALLAVAYRPFGARR